MKHCHYNLGMCFEDIATIYGQRQALCTPDRVYTYNEIFHYVERLACLLLQKGCSRGSVIALGHNKHPLSYALMLAALRVGITYVNLDVGAPVARTSLILQICKPSLIFYDDESYMDVMEELASSRQCPLMLLSDDQLPHVTSRDLEQQKKEMVSVDSSSIAYVMFTSGSTGIPKGVAITHGNLLPFISWGQERFGITDQDNFANLSPMYFDNSVFDFYVGLFSGAALTPVPREVLSKPYELVDYVGKMGCSVWFSVPSLLIYLTTMKAMRAAGLPSLRVIIFGGEGYPKVELKKLYDEFSESTTLVNVYGPTECTCICSAYTLQDKDFRDIEGLPTLGRLNPNFDYRILDEHEHDSDSGELCLIGPHVAAGYFNDVERTEKAFFTLTDSRRFMKRMYRTGDLVCARDEKLYFMGRKDNQIKHMGYRIELEDIEHALIKLPQVNQAAVIYHRTSSAYGKLIGYVACDSTVTEKDLLTGLSEFLPDYMMPHKLILMVHLPKNNNGKIDRQYLNTLLKGEVRV